MAAKTCVVNGMVECDVKLNGKTVLITGANSGIGFSTALDMIKRGAKLLMAGRSIERMEEAKAKLLEEVEDSNIVLKKLDLGSLASVRECAKDINETEARLDILINNAGVMLCPPGKTVDGFDYQFGVNHVGHFLLTNLLLDLLKKSAPSRIVIVASTSHGGSPIMWNNIAQDGKFNSFKAYAQSKTANILHCIGLSKRLQGTGVTCYSLHPGIVKTNLQRNLGDVSHLPLFPRLFVKAWPTYLRFMGDSIEKTCQTSIYCAIAPELENESGKYYSNCSVANPSRHARDSENASRLWKVTEELIERAEKKEDESPDAVEDGGKVENALAEGKKKNDAPQKSEEEKKDPATEGAGDVVTPEKASEQETAKNRDDATPGDNATSEDNTTPPDAPTPGDNAASEDNTAPPDAPTPGDNATSEDNTTPGDMDVKVDQKEE